MTATTGREAVEFVEAHGLVMQSARVPGVPSLVEAIVGTKVRGSWWGHPKGRLVFRILGEVTGSPDVLAMRLVHGKLTLVHRRLWPALVRLAGEIGEERLAAVGEEHTPSGRHVATRVPFPDWVAPDVKAAAMALGEDEARELVPLLSGFAAASGGPRRGAARPEAVGSVTTGDRTHLGSTRGPTDREYSRSTAEHQLQTSRWE